MARSISTFVHRRDPDARGTDAYGKCHEITVSVRFQRREWGGYDVRRVDNGRLLGWVTPAGWSPGRARGGWDTHIAAEAFKGDHVDDTGHLLDHVPGDLVGDPGGDGMRSPTVAWGFTREDATESLIHWLYRHKTPAVGFGFGPHYRVERHNRELAARVDAILAETDS